MSRRLPVPTTKGKQRIVLDQLIRELRAALRRALAIREQLHNRTGRRGRRSSRPTHDVARRIRRYHRLNRTLSMQELSVKFKVSVGRVSEIIRGKRR